MSDKVAASETIQDEKWKQEIEFRERELSVKEKDFAFRQEVQQRSGWRSPLVVAIIGASVVAAGNAAVTWYDSKLARAIEEEKAESARILEVIKTGNPDKAAVNLKFLLDTKLIVNQETVQNVNAYLGNRLPGGGVVLGTEVDPERMRQLFKEWELDLRAEYALKKSELKAQEKKRQAEP